MVTRTSPCAGDAGSKRRENKFPHALRLLRNKSLWYGFAIALAFGISGDLMWTDAALLIFSRPVLLALYGMIACGALAGWFIALKGILDVCCPWHALSRRIRLCYAALGLLLWALAMTTPSLALYGLLEWWWYAYAAAIITGVGIVGLIVRDVLRILRQTRSDE